MSGPTHEIALSAYVDGIPQVAGVRIFHRRNVRTLDKQALRLFVERHPDLPVSSVTTLDVGSYRLHIDMGAARDHRAVMNLVTDALAREEQPNQTGTRLERMLTRVAEDIEIALEAL